MKNMIFELARGRKFNRNREHVFYFLNSKYFLSQPCIHAHRVSRVTVSKKYHCKQLHQGKPK